MEDGGLVFAGVALLLAAVMFSRRKSARNVAAILQERGVLLRGTVRSVERTGTEINHLPVADVTVSARDMDGKEITLEERRRLDPLHAKFFEVGAPAYIRIDPQDHSTFLIILGSDVPPLPNG